MDEYLVLTLRPTISVYPTYFPVPGGCEMIAEPPEDSGFGSINDHGILTDVIEEITNGMLIIKNPFSR